MATNAHPQPVTRQGLAAALVAYLMWGLLPIYFIWLHAVAPLEVLAHRIVWAIPLGIVIVLARRQWAEVVRALTAKRTLSLLIASSALIAINWFVYIIAVQQGQVFQASLGYYINPLINVVVGVAVFSERLTRAQTLAVGLAAVGVLVLTLSGGTFPWIAIVLALSFALYGVIRKQIDVGAMPGLFIETLILAPLAAGYLVWLVVAQTSVFRADAPGISLILIAAGPLTVIPLLFFALAARGLPLSVLGILQFIAPTLQFLVGLAYGEALTLPHLVCFACIWTAIALFAADAWYSSRRSPVTAGVAALRSSQRPVGSKLDSI